MSRTKNRERRNNVVELKSFITLFKEGGSSGQILQKGSCSISPNPIRRETRGGTAPGESSGIQFLKSVQREACGGGGKLPMLRR